MYCVFCIFELFRVKMSSVFARMRLWPFRKSGPAAKGVGDFSTEADTVIRAYTDTIESTVKYEWNIKKFGHLFPNPSSTNEVLNNVLFRRLHSPSFAVDSINSNLNPTKWHVQMICDDGEEPNPTSMHFLEISLKLEDIGQNDTNEKLRAAGFINPIPEFAIRCKMDLVNDKEEVMHTESMGKTMSLNRSKCGFLGFTTLENLWKEQSKFFPDNILRIRVQLTVISETTAISDDIRLPPSKMDRLGKDFADLLHSGNLADVMIRCQSKTFSAHKQVLSARCSFFEGMFSSKMKESVAPHVVDIVDIEPDIFSSLLHYLYTDSLDFPPSDLRKLSALTAIGDKYGLEDLKDHCFACLQVQINLSNAGTLAVLAYFYNADPKSVGKNIRLFCHTNWSALSQDPEFKKLVQDYPAAFVRDF